MRWLAIAATLALLACQPAPPALSPSPGPGAGCGDVSDLVGNVRSLEQRLGRGSDLVSRYYGWNQLPFDDQDVALRDSGHLLLIDVRARDFATGGYVSWTASPPASTTRT